MKPLELTSVAEIWRAAFEQLRGGLAAVGRDPQVWFPWGTTWRGHDLAGSLPPTELPDTLRTARGTHFAGRSWQALAVGDVTWLISLKRDADGRPETSWQVPDAIRPTLQLLGEFVRLECLLGLTLRILEQRAGEHAGHWDRVRHMALAVGRKMGLHGRDLVDLELTALLHDIGKVALPPPLLEISRTLTTAERRQIETHSVVGAAMVREIPGLDRVAEAVLYHHEAPDGSGYPRGLTAAEIPLASQIVGVVDAFDAMTHFRPYAQERTYKDTLDEMIRQTGKWDDRVLWALQEVLKHLGILDTHPMSPVDAPAPDA